MSTVQRQRESIMVRLNAPVKAELDALKAAFSEETQENWTHNRVIKRLILAWKERDQ